MLLPQTETELWERKRIEGSSRLQCKLCRHGKILCSAHLDSRAYGRP